MQVDVTFRNLPGTGATVGWTGSRTIVADRPEGKAGGGGLGFNGAQLLALALGGCFCNDLRYAAEKLHVDLEEIAVDVSLVLEGDPLVATSAKLKVRCKTNLGADAREVVESARASCMVANSMVAGLQVAIEQST